MASMTAMMNAIKLAHSLRALRQLCLDDGGGRRSWRQSWPRRTTSCFNAKSFKRRSWTHLQRSLSAVSATRSERHGLTSAMSVRDGAPNWGKRNFFPDPRHPGLDPAVYVVRPKAYKRLSDAFSTQTAPVHLGGRRVCGRRPALHAGAHLGPQGVETGKRAFTISIDYAQASYD